MYRHTLVSNGSLESLLSTTEVYIALGVGRYRLQATQQQRILKTILSASANLHGNTSFCDVGRMLQCSRMGIAYPTLRTTSHKGDYTV